MNHYRFKLITVFIFCTLVFNLLNGQAELISKTKLYDINGTKYVSAVEYAKTQNIRTIFYNDKEKHERHSFYGVFRFS